MLPEYCASIKDSMLKYFLSRLKSITLIKIKKMKNILYALFSVLVLISCQADVTSQDAAGNKFIGEKITMDGAIDLGTMVNKLATSEKFDAKVKGKIDAVCQAKGCWMNLVNDEGNEVFVKFKDYGFFMPLDCAGKEVVLEGYAFKEVTSVDELRHYAEDNGDTPEQIAAITEPKEELKFMAHGVILLQ